MSHVTALKTALTNRLVLEAALDNLNLNYSEITDAKPALSSSTSAPNSDSNREMSFVVVQPNGSNIGFIWTGENYEVGIDFSQWQQSRSVMSFMLALEQEYAMILLMSSAKELGFQTDTEKNYLNESTVTYKLTCKTWN